MRSVPLMSFRLRESFSHGVRDSRCISISGRLHFGNAADSLLVAVSCLVSHDSSAHAPCCSCVAALSAVIVGGWATFQPQWQCSGNACNACAWSNFTLHCLHFTGQCHWGFRAMGNPAAWAMCRRLTRPTSRPGKLRRHHSPAPSQPSQAAPSLPAGRGPRAAAANRGQAWQCLQKSAQSGAALPPALHWRLGRKPDEWRNLCRLTCHKGRGRWHATACDGQAAGLADSPLTPICNIVWTGWRL